MGDIVSTPYGTNATVIQIHPQGVKSVYKLTFLDGSSCEATADHLWYGHINNVVAKKDGRKLRHGKDGYDRVFTTNQIEIQTRKANNHLGKNGNKGHFLIPLTFPVEINLQHYLPVDPYVLGVLIGDGSLSDSVTFCTEDVDIITSVESKLGFKVNVKEIRDGKNNNKVYHLSIGNNFRNKLLPLCLLYHRAWEKFIPEIYKYTSIENRYELLRGLMDTDGTVSKEGKIYYCTTSEQLAEDIKWLVESLGGIATISTKNPVYTYKSEKRRGRRAYNLYIKLPDPAAAFHLSRKKSRCKVQQGLYRKVVEVEHIGTKICKCITIDDPRGLYLTENFIVTHNSAALCAEAIRECREVPGNNVLLARKELVVFKRTTLVELQRLLDRIPEKVVHRITEQRFVFPNGSFLHYTGLGSEKDIEKLKGLELGMIGIDEASEIEKPIFLAAGARLRHQPASKANRIKYRLTSNPEPGWLKEDFIDVKREGYRYIPATPKDNPYLPPDYVDHVREMFRDTPEWAEAYLEGNWDAFTGSDQVIPSHYIKEALNRYEITPAGYPVVWGIDVARYGDDKTVLVERAGWKFRIIAKWQKIPTPQQAREIAAIYRISEEKPVLVNVDDIGVGGGVTDQLAEAGLPVRGVNVSRASRKDPEKFANLKAEIWWHFRKMMETGNVALPPDPEFRSSIGAVRYDYLSGKIHIEEKKIVKKKMGRSPDEADALVLAAYEGPGSFVDFDDYSDGEDEEVELSPQEQDEQHEYAIHSLLKLMERSW